VGRLTGRAGHRWHGRTVRQGTQKRVARGDKKCLFLVYAPTQGARNPAPGRPLGCYRARSRDQSVARRRHQYRGFVLPGVRVFAPNAVSVQPGAATAAARLLATALLCVQIQALQRPAQWSQASDGIRAVSKCAVAPRGGRVRARAPGLKRATRHRRALKVQVALEGHRRRPAPRSAPPIASVAAPPAIGPKAPRRGRR
jgi:hypothetical protein